MRRRGDTSAKPFCLEEGKVIHSWKKKTFSKHSFHDTHVIRMEFNLALLEYHQSRGCPEVLWKHRTWHLSMYYWRGKFIFNREKAWAEPRMVGWGVDVVASVDRLLTYDWGNLKGQEENQSLLSVARCSLLFFKVALPILPIFCVLWFLLAWCHSTLSPQWGNRCILVRVNSPQTLGRYGADCVGTANKSPPADLKWVVGRVVVNGEGEGNHERGLMNTGRIDLLTGLLSVTSAPLFSGQMLLQQFVELPQRPWAEWRGIHGGPEEGKAR